MALVFVIGSSYAVEGSLRRYFRHVRGLDVHCRARPTPRQGDSGAVVSGFRQVMGWIEGAAASAGGGPVLRDALIFIDLYDASLETLDHLNPTATNVGDWPSIVGMLILAVPEAHWVLIAPYPDTRTSPGRAHRLLNGQSLQAILALQDEGFSPLFDPTGLRDLLRRNLRNQDLPDGKRPTYVPLRRCLAAAIDEEAAYAYFHAYAAYRFGFRAHVVTSYAMTERLLADTPAADECWRKPLYLTFEDLFLGFPDRPPAREQRGTTHASAEAVAEESFHSSDLVARDAIWPHLAQAVCRVFVTVGHRRGIDADCWRRNTAYLREQRASVSITGRRRWNTMLYKPFSGLFDLWKRSGLYRRLGGSGYPGLAPEFLWPVREAGDERVGGHSAPGRLLEVADRLIARSERVLEHVKTVPDAVHGALLATDAVEYLGHRTPTTALEALALKHQLEVTAECMFYGVDYNMDVESRLRDIEREVNAVGRWFRPQTRRMSVLSANLSIVNQLVRSFRDYNQFDEEMECLAKSRELQRGLWYTRSYWWAWMFWPIRWYIDFLLGRMHRFVIAIILWVVGIAGLWAITYPPKGSTLGDRAVSGFAHALGAFFGVQPPVGLADLLSHSGEGYPFPLVISIIAILAGFLHLGIFVSHLYAMMARR